MYTLLRTDCRVLIKINHGLAMIVETDELKIAHFLTGIFHFCLLEKLKITGIEVEAYQEVSFY